MGESADSDTGRSDSSLRAAGTAFAPIVLEGWAPPRELSPNASRNIHWGTRTKIKNETKLLFTTLAFKSWSWPAGHRAQTETGRKRRLTITVRKPRESDIDKLTAQLKVVIDSLVRGGAALDDRPKYLELVIRQEKGPKRTTLELEEISP